MGYNKKTLNEAIKFHGHLGPYLVLGMLMGKCALKNLKAKKYFGLAIKVKGAYKKPKSCLIDGLQLSTGATFGKGNIKKLDGRHIQVFFYNLNNKRKIALSLKDNLKFKLAKLKHHRASEVFAEKIYKVQIVVSVDLLPVLPLLCS
jgi:formylmethanofuran dehydrogenase subunit E